MLYIDVSPFSIWVYFSGEPFLLAGLIFGKCQAAMDEIISKSAEKHVLEDDLR